MDLRHLAPRMWHRLYRTDPIWDAELLDAIDAVRAGSPIKTDGCVSVVAGLSVWTENWPYAYGHPYGQFGKQHFNIKVLPTRRTAVLLRDLLSGLDRAERRKELRDFIDASREARHA